MKTLYLGTLACVRETFLDNGQLVDCFVIGVRGAVSCDLSRLERFPQIKFRYKFPEVHNARYLQEGYIGHHILQPAVIYWEDEKQTKKAVKV